MIPDRKSEKIMRKIAIALAAFAFGGNVAVAGDLGDKLAGFAAMQSAVPQTVVLPNENWAVDAAWAHTRFSEYGIDGHGNAIGIGVGVKVNNGFQVNMGAASSTQDFGSEATFRLGGRIGGKWMAPAQ